MEINQDIISEIKGVKKSSPEIKEFLIWLVNFEKERLDRDKPSYKLEIMKKMDEIIKGNEGRK